METPIFLILCFFVVALLYSSVGHGGASGYLAIMALLGMAPSTMKSTALILNLFVAGIAFISFYKGKFFKSRLLWPFIITSMPMAYIGAQISINSVVYKFILGICLLIAVGKMLYKPKKIKEQSHADIPILLALTIGAGLGIFSGMIGIGGGIILSPLLLLFNWASIKESAAVSAPFIFLNSLAGLFGLAQKGFMPGPNTIIWIISAIAGGIIGSYAGSHKFSFASLKYILAGVLCFAAIKLIII